MQQKILDKMNGKEIIYEEHNTYDSGGNSSDES
jgi:hypothetical protein